MGEFNDRVNRLIKGLRSLCLPGDLVSIYGEVSKVGRSSITIALETVVQRRLDPTPIQVTHGTFVFVAIDDDGKPRQVKA